MEPKLRFMGSRERLLPKFRLMGNGEPVMKYSSEAAREKAKPKSGFAEPHHVVERKAREAVTRARGDINNRKHFLGQHIFQIGQYYGCTFKWLLENDLGFAAYLVSGMKHEKKTDAPLSQNKFAFRDYFLLFPECLTALNLRAKFKSGDKAGPLAGTEKRPQQQQTSLVAQQANDVTDEELVSVLSKVEAAMTQGPVATYRIPQPVATFRIPRQLSSKTATTTTTTCTSSSQSNTYGVPLTAPILSEEVKAALLKSISAYPVISQATTKQESCGTESSPKHQPLATTRQTEETLLTCTSTASPLTTTQTCPVFTSTTTIVTTTSSPVSTCSTSYVTTASTSRVTTASIIPLSSGLTDEEVFGSSATYLSVPSIDELDDISEAISVSVSDSADTVPSLSSVLQPPEADYPIPESWKGYVPKIDQRWISKAIFTMNARGNPEVDLRKADKLWYSPPQPQLIPTSQPKIDRYFGHRLLLWMPKKLWKVKLMCPYCKNVELVLSGPYRVTRMVLDIDSFYILATEYLCCKNCRRFQIGWSNSVLNQLDPGHRSQFPVLITRKKSCDVRVIRLLRQRGLGNSPTQLYKKLVEQHDETRLTKIIQYMTDCSSFKRASNNGLVVNQPFEKPPAPIPVPRYQWLQFVYCLDVLQRLDEVKAAVTSVFGRVLKLDSTKKITKKLAGHAFSTAAWCTNISNEYGQVLQSVMTAGEGYRLEPMIQGVTKRYQDAAVPAPEILYVDSQCCGTSPVSRTFRSAWPDLLIRLDIWHFMRRLAVGVTTDTHRLYATFMSQLSRCIFQWDQGDLALLKQAKRSQMELSHIENPSEEDVIKSITRNELALHCRRATRGKEETTQLLFNLLEMFDSDKGHDTMGVPLLHHDRIWELWDKQKRHIECIQDPPGIPLYTQTGTLKKGNVVLPVYRCARGSTSLESFHLHLMRFIPGTTASAANFQAYVVEGIRRWNKDRATAAVRDDTPKFAVYNSLLQHAANQLADEIFGEPLIPNFSAPRKYTGEKIGIEYLFSQTGDVLDNPLEEDTEGPEPSSSQLESEDQIDEGFVEVEEEVEDVTISDPVDAISVSVPLETRSSQEPTERVAYELMLANRPSQTYLQVSTAAEHVPSVPQPSSGALVVSVSNTEPVSLQPGGALISLVSTTSVTESVPAVPTASPSTSVVTSMSTSQESLGPGNIGGYEKVEALAQFLVSLLSNTHRVINNEQAKQLIHLWNDLPPYDTMHTRFAHRFQTSLISGRFKQPKQKRLEMTPGVDSVKRCFLGSNKGPAQVPGCNRYVESVITKLCQTHPSPTKQHGQRKCRWNMILRDYESIREMVYSCQRVYNETTIQLPSINQKTLTYWFNNKDKSRDRAILEQGLTLQVPKTAAEPLPLPLQKPAALDSGISQSEHQFILQPNTTGMTQKVKRRILPELKSLEPVPILPKPTVFLQTQPADLSTEFLVTEETLKRKIPYSTERYKRKKLEKEAAGLYTRSYNKSAQCRRCRQCGKDVKSVGHVDYFKNIYCPENSDLTVEEWKAPLRLKYARNK